MPSCSAVRIIFEETVKAYSRHTIHHLVNFDGLSSTVMLPPAATLSFQLLTYLRRYFIRPVHYGHCLLWPFLNVNWCVRYGTYSAWWSASVVDFEGFRSQSELLAGKSNRQWKKSGSSVFRLGVAVCRAWWVQCALVLVIHSARCCFFTLAYLFELSSYNWRKYVLICYMHLFYR